MYMSSSRCGTTKGRLGHVGDKSEENSRQERRQGHNTLLVKTMMLTEFFLSLPSQFPLRHCRGERRISILWSTLFPPTLSLSTSLSVIPTSPQKGDALQWCSLRQLGPAVYPQSKQEHAGRSCLFTKHWQKVRLLRDTQLQIREQL